MTAQTHAEVEEIISRIRERISIMLSSEEQVDQAREVAIAKYYGLLLRALYLRDQTETDKRIEDNGSAELYDAVGEQNLVPGQRVVEGSIQREDD